MRTLLLVAAIAFSCVTAAAQDLPDADAYRRLRSTEPADARDLQDLNIHECLRGGSSSERIVDVCTWVIDVAHVAGPLAGEAYTRRARAYAALGDLETADEDFGNGILYWDQTQPDEPPGIEVSGPHIGAAPAITLSPVDHAAAHCERGDFYWRQSNNQRARTSYERALLFHPACAERPLEDIVANRASPNGVLRHLGTYVAGEHQLNLTVLNGACSTQRAAALLEAFGPRPTPEQTAALDARMSGSLLSSRDPAVLRSQYDMFSASGGALNAYGACLFRHRLLEIDAQHQFAPPAPDPFANLPRRAASAGTAALADSVDPARRAQRQQEETQRLAEVERREQERRAQSSAFWNTVLEVGAVALNTYVQVETARIQAEAAQPSVPLPPAPSTYRGGGYAEALPPMGQSGGTSVEGQNQAAAEPMGQRIFDTPEQYAATTGANGGGGRVVLNPQTGQPCVTQTNTTTRQHGNGDVAHMIHFANSCGRVFSVAARRIPGPNGTYDNGISSTGILEYGQMYLTCIEVARPTGHSCRGFSEWWVRE